MKAEMVLRARLAEGGVFLEFPQNEGLKEALKKAALQCEQKANGWALITLQPPKRPRTTGEGSQNHHLNGHIGQIALETGNGQTAVKLVVKELAVEQFGYPTVKVGKKNGPAVRERMLHGRMRDAHRGLPPFGGRLGNHS